MPNHGTMAILAAALVTATAAAEVGDRIEQFFPEAGTVNAVFGSAVAIGGSTVVIGAAADNENGFHAGAAYVTTVTTGSLTAIRPADAVAGDRFGIAVATDGALILVGADRVGGSGGTGPGAVYVFDALTGAQLDKIMQEDWTLFGRALALDETTAVVGASRSAFVVDIAGEGPPVLLQNPTFQIDDEYGRAVAIGGNVLAVGASLADPVGESSGHVVLFDRTTHAFQRTLHADDGGIQDQLGWSVATNGTVVLAGAPFDDDAGENSGAAYVFDARSGDQLMKLVPDDHGLNDQFGSAVALSGDIAVIGSRHHAPDGLPTGAAYVFDLTTGRQIVKLVASDGAFDDDFGEAVAVDGSIAVVGADGHDGVGPNAGSAYAFEVAPFPACLGDTNDDLTVDIDDIVNVVLDFGTDGSANGGDRDSSGLVDIDDIVVVVLDFGPCPAP